MTILSVVVLIPLCSLVIFSAQLSPAEFFHTITTPRVLKSYWISIGCSFVASTVNAFMGLALAWILVRYEFPGKRFVDGIIELPFALPTAVAGIALTHMTTTNGWIGKVFFDFFNIRIAYTITSNYFVISLYCDIIKLLYIVFFHPIICIYKCYPLS